MGEDDDTLHPPRKTHRKGKQNGLPRKVWFLGYLPCSPVSGRILAVHSPSSTAAFHPVEASVSLAWAIAVVFQLAP